MGWWWTKLRAETCRRLINIIIKVCLLWLQIWLSVKGNQHHITCLSLLLFNCMVHIPSCEAASSTANQEIPLAFCVIRSFVTPFTTAPSHYPVRHPILNSILILSSQLRLCVPSDIFTSDFPTKTFHALLPYMLHATPIPLPSMSAISPLFD